jgi:hypothetical protein
VKIRSCSGLGWLQTSSARPGSPSTTLARLSFMALRITRDPKRFEYMDEAMTRVTDDEEFTLDLLTQTQGAKQAVARKFSA